MSCFYSNYWPGAWVSDYCLLTTFKQASCWMPSSAAAKMCTSASTEWCWGLDEASFHKDRLSFPCYSIFCLSEKWALSFLLKLDVAGIQRFWQLQKGCQVILNRIRLFLKNLSWSVNLLILMPANMQHWRYRCYWCYKEEHFLCV